MSQQYLTVCNNSLAQGKHTEAKAGFQYVLMDNPSSFEAYRGLATCELYLKNWREALQAAVNALIYGGNKAEDLSVLLTTLEASQLNTYIPELIKPLLLATDIQSLESRATAQLWQQLWDKYLSTFTRTDFVFDIEVSTLLKDGVFCKLLSRSLIVDYKMEDFVFNSRQELLRKASAGEDIVAFLPFLSSLSCLMLLNDGLYFTSNHAQRLLDSLTSDADAVTRASILLTLCHCDNYSAVALWNKHKGLFESDEFDELNKDFQFYSRVFEGDYTEVSEIDVSATVQSFYMNNPYPKWKSTTTNAIDISTFEFAPGQSYAPNSDILFAGCGTGKQIIGFALTNPKSNITAIDLSPQSVTFAKLMAQRYGITNVTFHVHNLLDISTLKRSFDFIICTGVLHHLAVPKDGLAALENVLKPSGSMFLAFYSRAARESLLTIKDEILKSVDTKQGSITQEALKKWRASLSVEQKNNPQYKLQDFFYLNGLYDLLFHPQQSEYSMLEIASMLEECSLNFTTMNQQAFSLALNNKVQKAAGANAKTVDFWHNFELKNPQTFTGMFEFLVRKTA